MAVDYTLLRQKIEATLLDIKGGPGSGNFGHAGRKGKRGGSAPKGGGTGNSEWGKERVDTSDLPLARGAAWNDLNDADTREYLLDKAERGKLPDGIDNLIQPDKLAKLESLANNDEYRISKPTTVYFGLEGEKFSNLKEGEEFAALGTRSTTSTISRANDYAGAKGTVFEVELPSGTLAVPSKVLGIEETMLLPGARFEVASREGNHVKLKLKSDGVDYINELVSFKKQVDEKRGAKKSLDLKGGPGSGNFGHGGRPGKRGGSSPKTASPVSPVVDMTDDHVDQVIQMAEEHEGDDRYSEMAIAVTEQDKRTVNLVHVTDGKVDAAMIMKNWAEDDWEIRHIGSIKKGAGTALVREGEKRAEKAGASKIRLLAGDEGAEVFWTKMGYTKLDESGHFEKVFKKNPIVPAKKRAEYMTEQEKKNAKWVFSGSVRPTGSDRHWVKQKDENTGKVRYVSDFGGKQTIRYRSHHKSLSHDELYLEVSSVIKGGPGSGNHRHSGRPGKRGGSASRTGTTSGGGESTQDEGPVKKDITVLDTYFQGSTDHSVTALMTQQAIAEKFDLEFPEYHTQLLDNMLKSRDNYEGQTLNSMNMLHLVYSLPFESENGTFNGSKDKSQARVNTAISKIYKDTQADLGGKDQILYRAHITGQPTGVVQSWTSDKAIAERFHRQRENEGQKVEILTRTIPAKEIFSTYKTGMGHSEEKEFLVLNTSLSKKNKKSLGDSIKERVQELANED